MVKGGIQLNIDAISKEGMSNKFSIPETKGKAAGVHKDDMQSPVQTIHDMESNLLDQEMLQSEEGKKLFDELLNASNEIIFGANNHFQFQVHEKTGTTMVKLVDNDSQEVIKEFPPEKILNVVAGIWELAGIIVDKKV